MIRSEIEKAFTQEFVNDPEFIFDIFDELPTAYIVCIYTDNQLLEYKINYENNKRLIDKIIKDLDIFADLHIERYDSHPIDDRGNIDLILICEAYENIKEVGYIYYDKEYHIFYDKYIHDTNDWRN